MARLGDIATYINGYAFKPTDWSNEGIPIIRIQDLTGNSYQANRFDGEYDPKYEVNYGDVLISWSASLGVYVWTGERAVLNQHIFKVSFDKAEIDKSFFVHQVECILDKASGEAHGATMKHLTKPIFDALPFFLPNIHEQKRIAQELDQVSNLIFLRKQQLLKLDELVKSRFIEMFGDLMLNQYDWPVVKISDVSLFLKSGLSRKLSDKDIGLPVIRSGNIQNGQFLYDDIKYWYKDDPQGSKTGDYILEDGDILVNFINSASQIGKTAIFRNVGRDCIYTTNIFRMKLAEKCNEYYYNWFAMSDYYYRQLQNIIQPAVNQASFTTVNFLKLDIPLPPLELQKQFAAFVEQIDKSKFEIQKSLEKLETLKKALMQKYFG